MRLTAVKGKRWMATVVLDNGGRRQQSSSTIVVALGGDSDGVLDGVPAL
jgi:hypothetical protein